MTARRALAAAFVLPLALVACNSSDKGTSGSEPAPQPARTTPAQQPTHAAKPHAEPPPDTTAETPRMARTGMRIRFGIMPGNYNDVEDGVLVGDVYPGTSAGDAGIKPGDRLMTWNGKPITTVEDWMEHMAPHKPGDVVDVGVLRDGRIIPIKVTLKAAE